MKTKPFAHQLATYEHSRDRTYFGVWWEQGTGKSKLVIDTMFYLHDKREITGVLLIAPNGVHGNFVTQELPVHAWGEYQAYVWNTGASTTKREQKLWERLMVPSPLIQVLVMSYDAVARTKQGMDVATQFLKCHKSLAVLDESTAIANPTTQRSKQIFKLAAMARYRRVLSGTPVADGPFKIFNQMRWLDEAYWKSAGLSNNFAFQNRFAVFETANRKDGHQFRALKYYRDLDYLHRLIAPHSNRVLKEDVLDLPPKLYSTVEFELAPEQRRIYDELRKTLRAKIDESLTVTVESALVALMRLQQVTSGYIGTELTPRPALGMSVIWRGPVHMIYGVIDDLSEAVAVVRGPRVQYGETIPSADDNEDWTQQVRLDDPQLFLLAEAETAILNIFPEDSHNPRLRALEAVLDPITHKVIVWARYTRDIDGIMRMLGDRAVRYDGQTKTAEREAALTRFRGDPSVQYFVANPMTLSMGVTLTQAKTVVYYSNTFQLEKRLQSEDRAHRIGQDVSVSVIDLVARDTVDSKIVTSLRKKFNLAAQVNGDRARDWI